MGLQKDTISCDPTTDKFDKAHTQVHLNLQNLEHKIDKSSVRDHA